MLSKSELNQIERCKEFIQGEDGKRRGYLLVHIYDVCDMDTNQIVPISKIDSILRMNGYKGILILDNQEDNYFIIDIYSKKMINLPGKIEEFTQYAYKRRTIDFFEFVRMHQRIHGVFRNSITVTSRDKIETITICLKDFDYWSGFLKSKYYKTGNYLIVCATNYGENCISTMEKIFRSLEERGYTNAGRAIVSTPWFYISLNTKLWFSGYLGVDLLSGVEPVGNHAITVDEFYMIDDIYKKYEGYSVLDFKQQYSSLT